VTILFGFNFPAVLALVSAQKLAAATGGFSGGIGIAAAANTVGAISAIICGFFLLPRVGGFRLVAIAASLNVVLAVVLLLLPTDRIGSRCCCCVLSPLFLDCSVAAVFQQDCGASAGLYGNYQQLRR